MGIRMCSGKTGKPYAQLPSDGSPVVETSLSIMTFFEWGLLRYSYLHQTFTSSIKVHLR